MKMIYHLSSAFRQLYRSDLTVITDRDSIRDCSAKAAPRENRAGYFNIIHFGVGSLNVSNDRSQARHIYDFIL